jgi:hypothetical protein
MTSVTESLARYRRTSTAVRNPRHPDRPCESWVSHSTLSVNKGSVSNPVPDGVGFLRRRGAQERAGITVREAGERTNG